MLLKLKQIFELVTLIIGTIIGAGFISGAELLHFFPTEYIYYLLFAGILFIVSFYLLYNSGKKYGGFTGILQTVFKRSAAIVHICIVVASIILCGSMLAGFVSSLSLFFGINQFLPLYSLALLVVLFFVAFKGVKVVLRLNAILVPFMVILVFCFFKLPTNWQIVQMPTCIVVINIILFVAFNLFLSAPVICDLGKKHKQEQDMYLSTFVQKHTNRYAIHNTTTKGKLLQTNTFAICIATLLIVLTAAIILENILQSPNASTQALPFLYTIQGKFAKFAFAIAAIGGILTTLFSAYYTVHSSVENIKGKRKYRILFAIIAYLLSIIGLKYIIQFCYPIIGVMGLAFLAVLLIANCRKVKKESTTNQAVKNL